MFTIPCIVCRALPQLVRMLSFSVLFCALFIRHLNVALQVFDLIPESLLVNFRGKIATCKTRSAASRKRRHGTDVSPLMTADLPSPSMGRFNSAFENVSVLAE